MNGGGGDLSESERAKRERVRGEGLGAVFHLKRAVRGSELLISSSFEILNRV